MTVCRFKDGGGGLARKKGWSFWGGVDTPMHTMSLVKTTFIFVKNCWFKMSESLIFEWNEWNLNLTIHFLRGKGGGGVGGPHDADITLGGVVTKWWCLITKGEGGQESGKKWLHNK